MTGKITNKITLRSFFSGPLPVFVLAHCVHHLLTALPTPLLPMIRTHFDLSYTQSGWLISAFSLSYGIGQLPAGWLADRIGPRFLFAVGLCGVATSGLFIGLSSTYMMMIVFLILMGLLGGGYHPSAPPLISASVAPENLGRALGLHIIGGSASFFLSPLIAIVIASAWGWKSPFIVMAVPTFVFGIVFFRYLGRLDKVNNQGVRTVENQGGEEHDSGGHHQLVAIIILSTFTAAVLISTISFIPLLLVDSFGVSEKTGAALLSLIYSAGLWAAPIGGYLSDRFGKIPVVLAVCFLGGPVICMLNIFPYGIGTWLLLLALGICLSARMPIIESFIVSRASVNHRSTVLGIYYFSAMESGGLLTPVMGGFIDRFGFSTSFFMAGAALITVTLVCSLWLRNNRE